MTQLGGVCSANAFFVPVMTFLLVVVHVECDYFVLQSFRITVTSGDRTLLVKRVHVGIAH